MLAQGFASKRGIQPGLSRKRPQMRASDHRSKAVSIGTAVVLALAGAGAATAATVTVSPFFGGLLSGRHFPSTSRHGPAQSHEYKAGSQDQP
jgi:hypothetical protein